MRLIYHKKTQTSSTSGSFITYMEDIDKNCNQIHHKIMRRVAIICALAYTLVNCSTSNTVQSAPKAADDYWITTPKQGSLVILGVSGPQLKHETEIEAAKEDAARKASMYHGIRASFTSVQSIGTNFLDYFVDSQLTMEYDQQLEQYMDKLTFDPQHDVRSAEGSICIRFSYPVSFPAAVTFSSPRNPDGSPEWIKRPPNEIAGFMAETGYARRQARLKDTIAKSNESAVAALITRSSTTVGTSDISLLSSSTERNTAVIQQQSKGNLAYFTTLETWIDPESQAVWTLVIAQSVN